MIVSSVAGGIARARTSRRYQASNTQRPRIIQPAIAAPAARNTKVISLARMRAPRSKTIARVVETCKATAWDPCRGGIGERGGTLLSRGVRATMLRRYRMRHATAVMLFD